MTSRDGMNYAPRAVHRRVVEPEEFPVGVIGLDHGHIYGMCHGLRDAGAHISAVYDPDPLKIEMFSKTFPEAKAVPTEAAILDDSSIHMVASAAIPSERGPLGLRVQAADKHYFVDKAPFTTVDQLESARRSVVYTAKKWAVCYSERVQNESAVFAGQLINDGAIGTVLQVIGLGPHRLNAPNRPAWFFDKKKYGGILIDIGSHQIEQFLYYTGATDAEVVASQVGNLAHQQYPDLEDYGDATLRGNNGATNYFRVDWFTPDGLSTWGDGRTFILGTDGYIELRKYVDVARGMAGDQCYMVNGEGEHHFAVGGTVGYPYFGDLIVDCLEDTDKAMPQDHTFKAAELCLKAQQLADRVDRKSE